MTNQNENYWKKCSVCKSPIPYGATYQLCSVSTCNNSKTGLTFCSVTCWDSHLGFANHRSSCAEENVAPTKQEYERSLAAEDNTPSTERTAERKRIIPTSSSTTASPLNVDTLVVVSKVKNLIKEQSGFSTSQCAIEALTQIVVRESLRAVENTQNAGRKTVMGRDF
jgi:hypothetical protein